MGLLSFHLSAEDNTNYLIVKWQKKPWMEVECFQIPFTQKVKIRFPKEHQNAGMTRIVTESEIYEYETHRMCGILFVLENSSVQDISSIPQKLRITGDCVDIVVSKPDTRFGVFTIDGRIIMFDTLQPGEHSISLSQLHPGIYIVKLNNESFKILK